MISNEELLKILELINKLEDQTKYWMIRINHQKVVKDKTERIREIIQKHLGE